MRLTIFFLSISCFLTGRGFASSPSSGSLCASPLIERSMQSSSLENIAFSLDSAESLNVFDDETQQAHEQYLKQSYFYNSYLIPLVIVEELLLRGFKSEVEMTDYLTHFSLMASADEMSLFVRNLMIRLFIRVQDKNGANDYLVLKAEASKMGTSLKEYLEALALWRKEGLEDPMAKGLKYLLHFLLEKQLKNEKQNPFLLLRLHQYFEKNPLGWWRRYRLQRSSEYLAANSIISSLTYIKANFNKIERLKSLRLFQFIRSIISGELSSDGSLLSPSPFSNSEFTEKSLYTVIKDLTGITAKLSMISSIIEKKNSLSLNEVHSLMKVLIKILPFLNAYSDVLGIPSDLKTRINKDLENELTKTIFNYSVIPTPIGIMYMAVKKSSIRNDEINSVFFLEEVGPLLNEFVNKSISKSFSHNRFNDFVKKSIFLYLNERLLEAAH